MARRKKPLPAELQTAQIEGATHDGRGISHIEGKAVFIDGALPGEQVRFRYTGMRRRYATGILTEVLKPSPDRITPRCDHFAVCGGCSLQHLSPPAQITMKQALLLEQLKRIGKITDFELWPPLTGPLWGYRRKARLGVKYVRNKERVLVGFRERGRNLIADIEHCPVLAPVIGERLKQLAELIDSTSIKTQIPQIEVAVGDNRTALVIRVLAMPTEQDKEIFLEFGRQTGIELYLQPKGPESVIPLDNTNTHPLYYHLPKAIKLYFGPLDFTQVNADINTRMIERVLDALAPHPQETVLDLFCGLGNFTLPISRHAGRVIGVEGNPNAVEQARINARANQIDNVEFHCADLAKDIGEQSWVQGRYDKILLDPARSGALEIMDWLPKWAPQKIVYVSCNPATLARDLGELVNRHGYRLIKAGILDMFPHTAHVESIALLEP